MMRSKSVTAAAVLQFLWSTSTMVLTLPDLARGAIPGVGGAAGYAVTVLAFAVSVLGIVAAYLTWANMRAGKILAILVNIAIGFLLFGAVLFASPGAKVVAAAILVIPICIVFLLLRRVPKLETV